MNTDDNAVYTALKAIEQEMGDRQRIEHNRDSS
jgi:hypothetical protein